MGGQNSRMVRELVADSLYIVRQTNRSAYERSRAAHQEVQEKLEELRRVNQETLRSAESEAQRSEVFESFHSSVSAQKQQLDQVADEFAKQFELPKGYQNIADQHREERKKAEAEALAAKLADGGKADAKKKEQ